MGRRRERTEFQKSDEYRSAAEESSVPAIMKQRTKLSEGAPGKDQTPATTAPAAQVSLQDRPKSKKELRAEKKRTRRLEEDPDYAVNEEKRLLEMRKKEEEREQLKHLIHEERNQKKIRQQKRENRERNTPGAATEKKQKTTQDSSLSSRGETKTPPKKKLKTETSQEDEVAQKIIHELKYGSSDSSGWTTLRLGVKFKDIVVGNGPNVVQNKSLVTVKYQLTGGKSGSVIDSSKKFPFRVGKGEVIQGWDIGVTGMREGGRRQLMVPPKAGYGSQDIGAGPGGLLHFDITVLSIR